MKQYISKIPIFFICFAISLAIEYFINGMHLSVVHIAQPFAGLCLVFLVVHAVGYNNKNVRVAGDKLIITGIFKTVTLPKDSIQSFKVERNFLCTVFDWSLVTFTTPAGSYKIYINQIQSHTFLNGLLG